jgi:asparagine synthase (glutamine-hydrolysing)
MLYYRRLFESLPTGGRPLHDVDWMCFLGLKNIVPDYYLYRADRLGMAHSIELRVPFLDHEMVNYALSIPGRLKVAHGEPKYILKKTLERILPREVLYRKKQGFCVPLREWTGDIMLEFLDANLETFCRETNLFSETGLRHLIDHARSGNTNYTSTLWNVYFLMSWFKKWLL